MPFCLFRNAKIHYSVSGQGQAIVLLHGFLENAAIYTGFAKALSQRYKVVLIDLPGHGASESLGYVHTMDLMADAVDEVIKSLGIRKIILAGHSMGGYVALAYAEKHIKKIKGVLLIHSTANSDSEEKINDRNRAIKVVQRYRQRYLEESLKKLFRPGFSEELPKAFSYMVKMADKTTTQGIIAALEGMKIRKDYEIVLSFISFPIGFIIGKQDQLIPYEKLLHLSTLPANSYVKLIDNCGHVSMIEAPEESYQGLLEFIKRCK
jgi:pimeloyl-ACP methyl ester carboxylesterase